MYYRNKSDEEAVGILEKLARDYQVSNLGRYILHAAQWHIIFPEECHHYFHDSTVII